MGVGKERGRGGRVSRGSQRSVPWSTRVLARRAAVVLRHFEQLPTLPVVATRLLSLGNDDELDVREIVKLIESDPTLTARLLSLCRSAANRRGTPVTTVEMAVVLLGLETVRTLALSVEVFDWGQRVKGELERKGVSTSGPPGDGFGDEEPETVGFDSVGFWQHSISVACASELIAREHRLLGVRGEDAFVCGLVHDLGKLALAVVLPRAYERVVELARHRNTTLDDAEREVIGLDHHQAGKRLGERWGLPDRIVSVMWLHGRACSPGSDLPESGHRSAVAVVAVADALCRRLELGWSGSAPETHNLLELCERFGLDAGRVESVVPRLYEQASLRCKELGLGDEPSERMLVESVLRANRRLARLNRELGRANRELTKARDELAEAQVLARLGEMTAGAAHEMNTPLAVINGHAEELSVRLADERGVAGVRAIAKASRRLSTLIDRLHRVARPGVPRPEPTDVRVLVGQAVSAARARVGESAEGDADHVVPVRILKTEDIGLVWCDPGMLRDALTEIVANALESEPSTGIEVRVTTRELAACGALGRGGGGIHGEQIDAEMGEDVSELVVEVLDDGRGMSARALEHAMDPFFSEKQAGRQPGLGLALAQRLVRAQSGRVGIVSRAGEGTCVTVSLASWRVSGDHRGEPGGGLAAA